MLQSQGGRYGSLCWWCTRRRRAIVAAIEVYWITTDASAAQTTRYLVWFALQSGFPRVIVDLLCNAQLKSGRQQVRTSVEHRF